MRLKTYTHNDTELKYFFQPPKTELVTGKLLVVLTNCMERDGHLDFNFSLSSIKRTPKLFLASARDYQFGLYQIKNKSFVLQDAVEALIEKHRIESNISKSDVWIIGYCAASNSAITISVNKGYNCIVTEFSIGRSLFKSWSDDDIEKHDFISRWRESGEVQMDMTLEEYMKNIVGYTGCSDWQNITGEYLENIAKIHPEKLKIPTIYFYAGKDEEKWKLFGEETCNKLTEYGMNYELTVEEGFDHLNALPHFINYFLKVISINGIE